MADANSDSGRLACGDHQIDLWLTYYDEADDPALLGRLGALMNDAERAQQSRFYFADDRLRYLVTRALVRTVLSRYAAVAPADWEFTVNDYGRPEIAPRHGVPGLRFNLSHARGLIALAVTGERAVGVDVENVVVRPAALDIVDRFFSPREAAELASLPPDRRGARFFEYWTFKESYIKARGMGLSLPLDAFSFHFPQPREVRVAFDESCGDHPERWHFWQCRPSPDHLLALCAERSAGAAAPVVVARTVVPTVGDSPLAVQWLKRTAH